MRQQISIRHLQPASESFNGRVRPLMRLIQSYGDVGRFTAGRLTLVTINSAELTGLALGTHAEAFGRRSASQSFDWKLLSNGVVLKDVRTPEVQPARPRRPLARPARP